MSEGSEFIAAELTKLTKKFDERFPEEKRLFCCKMLMFAIVGYLVGEGRSKFNVECITRISNMIYEDDEFWDVERKKNEQTD